MDNLTHTLVGAALAETGLKRATPLATTLLLLAANFPDIDIITALWGPQAYLEYHRGVTHSLVGLPILAALLAAGVYGCSRWIKGRADAEPRCARFGPLLGLSLLAMATHPLLDFTNSYGWRPFLPWSNRWYYGDLAFVIDPWIWAGLGSVLFIITAQTRKRVLGWMLLFAGVIIFLTLAGGGLRVILPLMVCAALAVALKFVLTLNERRMRALSLAALIVLLAYFGALTLAHHVAVERAALVAALAINSEPAVQVHALPMETRPLWWRAVMATERVFYVADLPLVSEGSPPFQRLDRERGNPAAILAARRTSAAQAFLRFARFPIIEARPIGDQTEVEIRDVRFLRAGGFFQVTIRLDKNLQPIVER